MIFPLPPEIGIPLIVLCLVPVIICVTCLLIDTLVQIKYFKWNKEIREGKKEDDERD